MSKIVVFSDFHIFPFPMYSTIQADGLNSRLSDSLYCLDQIIDYCADERNGIDVALFGGDLFHTKKRIGVQEFNRAFEGFHKLSKSVNIFAIHGNHDQVDREGVDNSISTFSTNCTVANTCGWYDFDGNKANYSILAIPYTENLDYIKELVNIPCPDRGTVKLFLGHFGVNGAQIGSDFVYSGAHDPSIKDLCPEKFHAGFLGHFHMHQQLAPNFWYIGAPLQHNWGDSGQQRGFLVYDTNTKQVQQIPLKYPKFIKVTEKIVNTATNVLTNNFVKIQTNSKMSESEKEDLKESSGARSIEIEEETIENAINVPRIAINSSMSFEELISIYVKSGMVNTDGLDEQYLVDLGRSILAEIEK